MEDLADGNIFGVIKVFAVQFSKINSSLNEKYIAESGRWRNADEEMEYRK